MPEVAALSIRFDAEHGGFDRGIKHVENRVKGLSGQLKSAFGVGLGVIGANVIQGMVRGGVAQIESIVGAASDLNETKNKALEVFGADLNKQLVGWAKDAAQNMGMSREQAMAAVATQGNFFQAQGMDASTALQQGQQLVQLAADLGSFNNIDPQEVLQNLSSGLAGEAETLRKYGIDISEAALGQEALAQGISKSTTEMSMAEKSALRYAIIMKSTSKAQGDFGRTSGGLANQQRILAGKILDLKAALGGALLPVFISAAGLAISLVTGFERLTHTIGNFVDKGRELIGFFKDVFGSGTSVNSILDKLFGNNSAMYAGLGPGGLVDSAGGRLKELVQSMLLLADSAGHIFRAFQEGGVSGALDEFGNQWDRIKGEIADIGNVVIDVAVDAVVNIASWAWSAPPDVWAWVNAQLNGGSGDGNAAGINAGIGGSATGTTASVTLTDVGVNIASWAWGEVEDLWGWIEGELGVTSGGGGGVAMGGRAPGQSTPAMGGSAPVTLSDVGVNIASWAINQLEELGLAVKDKVTEWWPTVKDAIGNTWDAALEIGTWLITGGSNLFTAVSDKIEEWWPTVKDSIGNAWDATLEIGTWLIEGGSNLFTAVSDKLKEWWPIVQDSIGNAWDATLGIGTWLIEGGSALFTAVSDKLAEWWPIVQDSIGDAWEATLSVGTWLIEGGAALFTAFFDKLESWWPIVQAGIGDVWEATLTIGKWLIEGGETLATAVKDMVTAWWPSVRDLGQDLDGLKVNITSWALGEVDDLWAWLRGVLSGGGTGAGISAGIGGTGSGVNLSGVPVNVSDWNVGDVTSVFEAIGEKINVDLVSGDPLAVEKAHASGEKIGTKFGDKLWEGFVAGITGSEAGVGGKDQTFWQDITSFDPPADPLPGVDFLDRWVAYGQGIGSGILDSIGKGISAAIAGPKEQFTGMNFDALLDPLGGGITEAVTGFLQPLTDALSGIGDTIDAVVAPVALMIDTVVDTLGAAWDGLTFLFAGWGQEPWDLPEFPDFGAWLDPVRDLIFNLGWLTDQLKEAWKDLQFWENEVSGANAAASAAFANKNSLDMSPIDPGVVEPASAPIPVAFRASFDISAVPASLQPLVSGGTPPTIPPMKATLEFNAQPAIDKITGITAIATTFAATPFTGKLDFEAQPAIDKVSGVTAIATTFAAQMFQSMLDANAQPAIDKVVGTTMIGQTYADMTFTSQIDADNSSALAAFNAALSWGNAWDGRVFTASFNVDTSALTNAVAVAAQAAADIDALMPHSPAKKGPLSRTPNFSYITDSLAAAMSDMGPAAERGMGDVADQLGKWRKAGADLAGGSGALGKWRYADGRAGSSGGGKGDFNFGGLTVQVNAPVYGLTDLENAIVDTVTDKVFPAVEIAMRRHDRSWGLSS